MPSDYARTRVIGFSVTHSFWPAFYAAIPNPSAWELLWYSGGSVDLWADPNMPGWTYNGPDFANTGGLINPTDGQTNPSTGAAAVDRVVLNISGLAAGSTNPITGSARPDLSITGSTTGFPPAGYTNVVATWVAYIQAAIANIRSKYPNVRMIVLQPAVAGPGFAACSDGSANNSDSIAHGIRCTYTEPYIQSAIMAVSRANVRGGYIAQASACGDFADWAGHLNTTPQTTIGQAVAAYYAANL